MKILLITDDKRWGVSISERLKKEFKIDVVKKTVSPKNNYDLIVLNPDMNERPELLKNVKRKFPGIPVVIVGSNLGLEKITQYMRDGALYVHKKPYSAEGFKTIVNKSELFSALTI